MPDETIALSDLDLILLLQASVSPKQRLPGPTIHSMATRMQPLGPNIEYLEKHGLINAWRVKDGAYQRYPNIRLTNKGEQLVLTVIALANNRPPKP